MTEQKSFPLIGAHTSISGGVHNALLEGQAIGATTVQIFTANQRRWTTKPISEKETEIWYETLKKTGLSNIMSHDSYLINLGTSNPEIAEKSQIAFREEILRCIQLGITYLNFHPGAALKDPIEACLDRICDNLLTVADLVNNSSLRLLLETTAGQGSVVGCKFEEIAYILEKLKNRVRIGVCIDTCHIFAAGYDLSSSEACDATLKEFDKVIGLQHLYAFHLNDSMKECGAKIDRHMQLGEGKIGIDCFKFLMQDKRTKNLPKYLETPGGDPFWIKEIALLKSFT